MLILWDFGSVVVRLTEPAGSVVRPNLTEPLGSAEPEPEPNGSVAHYYTVLYMLYKCVKKVGKICSIALRYAAYQGPGFSVLVEIIHYRE